MTREEAINVVRVLTESTYFDDRELEGLRTLIPELRESEDERIRKEIIEYLQRYLPTDELLKEQEMVAWLEKKKEPKQEWSEEDDEMFNRCIMHLEQAKIGMPLDIQPSMVEEANFLRRIKSLRPQPQGTYRQIVHNIYDMLKDKDFFDIQPSHRVSLLNDIRVKCKIADECAEILDEPHWKPSEEQMEALESAMKLYKDTHFEIHHKKIVSLYEQLKKL